MQVCLQILTMIFDIQICASFMQPINVFSFSSIGNRVHLNDKHVFMTTTDNEHKFQEFVRSWFNRPPTAYLEGSNIDYSCIMSYPETTMSNPLMNVDLEEITTKIVQSAKISRLNKKKKRLFAVLKGSGGGKTRILEECRRSLIRQHNNILTIGITFNAVTELIFDPKWCAGNSKTTFLFAITARISSMFYQKEFRTERKNIIDTLSSIYRSDTIVIDDTVSSLAFLIQHLATITFQNRDVDTVVLLVDEIIKAEEAWEDRELGSVLRQALLGYNTMYEPDLNTALVMSSLELSPVGFTDSGRPVYPLILPERLNASQVVSTWWNITENNVIDSNKDMVRLHAIAEMFSDLPRALERTKEYLGLKFPNFSNISINTTFLSDFLKDMKREILDNYANCPFPSDEMFLNIVYDNPIVLDKEAMRLMRKSLLTNSITEFTEPDTILTHPQTSLIMLANSALRSESYLARLMVRVINVFFEGLTGFKAKGDVLELFTEIWSEVRLRAAAVCQKEITISTFLGISEEFLTDDENLIEKLEITIDNLKKTTSKKEISKKKFKFVHEMRSNLKLNDNLTFINEVLEVKVSETFPCKLIKFQKFERVDFCLKLFLNESHSFYLFMDIKSLSISNSTKTTVDLAKKASQHTYINELFKNSLIDQSQFLFVYFSTFNGPLQEIDNGKAIITNQETSAKFFGPTWPLYRASRATYS